MIAATLRHRHTGPGVSLEARRWRGRSRILLLSKASLEATGTGPITSTSYCVCFHLGAMCATFLRTLSTRPSAPIQPVLASARMGGSGILVSCLHLSSDRPCTFLSTFANIDMVIDISEYNRDVTYNPFGSNLRYISSGPREEKRLFSDYQVPPDESDKDLLLEHGAISIER